MLILFDRDLAIVDACCVHDEQILMAHLLSYYEPASRPVYNASHIVTIKFGLTLIQIADMVSAVSIGVVTMSCRFLAYDSIVECLQCCSNPQCTSYSSAYFIFIFYFFPLWFTIPTLYYSINSE